MNKAVFRFNEESQEYYMITQNGYNDGSGFCVEILVVNRNGSYWIEETKQGNLREYWIGNSRLCTEKEVEKFLFRYPEFKGYTFRQKIPYSIFVKEW